VTVRSNSVDHFGLPVFFIRKRLNRCAIATARPVQALRLGSDMQTFGLWRDPEMVGDPIEASGGNPLQLRLGGRGSTISGSRPTTMVSGRGYHIHPSLFGECKTHAWYSETPNQGPEGGLLILQTTRNYFS
jgi:hypothetical protein